MSAHDPGTIRAAFESFGRYVYMLVDPATGVPFYVGKGTGERAKSHENADTVRELLAVTSDLKDDEVPQDSVERELSAKDRALVRCGGEPEIWIIRQGMTLGEYTAVEAALIDLLMTMRISPTSPGSLPVPLGLGGEQLTNLRREKARGFGIQLLDDILDEFAVEPLDSAADERGLQDGQPIGFISITLGGWHEQEEDLSSNRSGPRRHRHGYGYKHEWLRPTERDKHLDEIALSAAGWWRIDPGHVQRDDINYAVVEHHGISRAVMRIDHDSWDYDPASRRRSFDYELLQPGDDLFDLLVGPHGKRLPSRKRGAMGVVRYWPDGVTSANWNDASLA